MIKDEVLTIEAQIKKYNSKGRTGSLGAILLHNAEIVITHYKLQSQMSGEANEILSSEMVKCHAEIQGLKENKVSEMAQRIQELSEENISLQAEIDHLDVLLNPKI